MRPEHVVGHGDDLEFLYQLGQRGVPVEAEIAQVAYVDGSPAWRVLFPDCPGAIGVVPAAEAGVPEKIMLRLVGQGIRVIVKGIDRELKIAACSRREAVAKAEAELRGRLKEGQVIEASVRAVVPGQPPSLLLDAGGGVMVEVPRKEAVRYLSRSLTEQYRPGQVIKAVVTGSDPLMLSVRKAYPDPFQVTVFKRGETISGTVCQVYDKQDGQRVVLVEPDLAPGMLGIAPAPLMGEVVRGDRVSCVVATYRPEKHQLRLRIRGWA